MNIDSSMKHQQQLINNDNDVNQKQQKLKKEQTGKQIVLHRALLTIPYFIGILWTTLHPILSVITGELKCRGQYIDENGLDVHRHRVESYPLQRHRSVAVADAPRLVTSSSSSSSPFVVRGGGMCQSIKLHSNSISPSIECLHHVASSAISFDIVRILPPMGPMIESSEAIVIVVGGNHNNDKECKYDDDDDDHDDWYTKSDMNASIMHMITKLGNQSDCPWLTKTVFIVSPTSSTSRVVGDTKEEDDELSLASIVDAFITSYMGEQSTNNNAAARTIHPLPPDFTFPIIRSVLVINDIQDDPDNNANNNSNGKDDEKERTVVRILPQGTSGTLPNLDLVFATFLSFQSQPASSNNKNRYDSSQSIYYSDTSTFSIHPFGNTLFEEQFGHAVNSICKMIGLEHKQRSVEQYAKDLVGLFGFVASFVIGP